MGLQIVVQYQNQPVRYEVMTQENEIFHLRLHGDEVRTGEDYLPQKIIIRRKGKIWVSDTDTYKELVQKLTKEISRFSSEYNY